MNKAFSISKRSKNSVGQKNKPSKQASKFSLHHHIPSYVKSRKLLQPLFKSFKEEKGWTSVEATEYKQYRQSIRSLMNPFHVYTFLSSYTLGVSSSALNVIAVAFPNSVVTTTPNWSALSSIFDEVRMIGYEWCFQPYNKYSKATTLSSPIIATPDDDDVSVPTSYDELVQYSDIKTSNTDDLFPKWTSVRVSNTNTASVTDHGWADIGTYAPQGSMKMYADGLSASVSYGIFFQRFILEFRMVR